MLTVKKARDHYTPWCLHILLMMIAIRSVKESGATQKNHVTSDTRYKIKR